MARFTEQRREKITHTTSSMGLRWATEVATSRRATRNSTSTATWARWSRERRAASTPESTPRRSTGPKSQKSDPTWPSPKSKKSHRPTKSFWRKRRSRAPHSTEIPRSGTRFTATMARQNPSVPSLRPPFSSKKAYLHLPSTNHAVKACSSSFRTK